MDDEWMPRGYYLRGSRDTQKGEAPSSGAEDLVEQKGQRDQGASNKNEGI